MPSSSLSLLQEVAEALAVRYLGQYTEELKAVAADRFEGKEINDALWGTVSLSKAEVALLDSPLLQRLRFLRQMGAAHWVYPGAVHTRFEHAIGALHQTQQLIDALNAQAARQGKGPMVSAQDAQLVKLSSLFSHVGRLAFSDSLVLELEALPDFATTAKDFAAEGEPQEFGADPSFCQLLAYYIVRSPTAKEFLLTLIRKRWLQFDKGDEEEAARHAVDCISLTVIGRRIDEYRPQLQGLVSGPFDSSTLDALVRDAKFAGIPSVLDIRRLIQKLAVAEVPLERLPDWITRNLAIITDDQTASPMIWIFGVPVGSTSILNELQLAQLLVTTKVRRHPKVLATEEMLRSVVRALAAAVPGRALLTHLYSTPEDVLVSMSLSDFASSVQPNVDTPLSEEQRERLNLAGKTLAAVRERRIWVRALQLADAVIEADSAGASGINRFYSELRHVQRGPQLLASIRDEVEAVLKASDQAVTSKEALAAEISLRSLPSYSAEPRVGRAVILTPGRHPIMLRETWEGGDTWVDQYLRGQPTLYLFAAPELADAVYVAVERLVDRLFRAELPPGTLEASKRKKKEIRQLKLLTAKPGFWRGQAWTIRPRPPFLGTVNLDKRIQQVALKLSMVQTISTDRQKRDLSKELPRWLEQFETDNDIECALTMLECLEVVDRNKTTSAFDAFFTEHPEFENAYAASFGDPKDGSVLQGYFAGDHPRIHKVLSLDQWSREPDDRPLILVDDCCGSGSQVCDVLAAWLERSDLREPLGEARDTLPKELQARLLKAKVAFVFITAWDVGVAKIRGRLGDLGFADAIVFPYLSDAEIPFLDKDLKARGGKLDVDAFIKRCADIGKEILESSGKPAEIVADQMLGYGNRGMLLATLVNVPTQTTTLIWKGGTVDGVTWQALLPRRKKT